MNTEEFETKLIDAAFALGAQVGWSRVSPAAAARHAGLDLAPARAIFSCTGAILKAFGRQADSYALAGHSADGTVRDKLFESLLNRFDYLQTYRPGMLALMRYLPFCPPLTLALAQMNITSMGWLLEGAGVDSAGMFGALKKRGLLAVWLYGLRVWTTDESPDLTATMAAIDQALTRAERLINRFGPSPSHITPAETTKEDQLSL